MKRHYPLSDVTLRKTKAENNFIENGSIINSHYVRDNDKQKMPMTDTQYQINVHCFKQTKCVREAFLNMEYIIGAQSDYTQKAIEFTNEATKILVQQT